MSSDGSRSTGDDAFEIVSEVLKSAMAEAPQGWRELMIRYFTDDAQSSQVVTCLVDRAGQLVEAPLPYDPELDGRLRALRAHLAPGGKGPFSEATLHLKADGDYEASYGYGPVNWDALVEPKWNFEDRTQVRV